MFLSKVHKSVEIEVEIFVQILKLVETIFDFVLLVHLQAFLDGGLGLFEVHLLFGSLLLGGDLLLLPSVHFCTYLFHGLLVVPWIRCILELLLQIRIDLSIDVLQQIVVFHATPILLMPVLPSSLASLELFALVAVLGLPLAQFLVQIFLHVQFLLRRKRCPFAGYDLRLPFL